MKNKIVEWCEGLSALPYPFPSIIHTLFTA